VRVILKEPRGLNTPKLAPGVFVLSVREPPSTGSIIGIHSRPEFHAGFEFAQTRLEKAYAKVIFGFYPAIGTARTASFDEVQPACATTSHAGVV